MSNPNGRNPYPNYPQANVSQPMGAQQPPMGGYPGSPYPGAGYSPRPELPQRKGSSARTLPIVAGIGVAVGVFGGLMIILGTGKSDASSTAAPIVTGSPDAGTVGSSGAMQAVVTTPDAGIVEVTIDAAPPEPETVSVMLSFDVEPSNAVIKVDGKTVDGGSYTVELGSDRKRRVKVEAKADGFRSWSKTITVTADRDEERVTIEMDKLRRRSGGGGRSGRGGGRRGGGSGGLIDL